MYNRPNRAIKNSIRIYRNRIFNCNQHGQCLPPGNHHLHKHIIIVVTLIELRRPEVVVVRTTQIGWRRTEWIETSTGRNALFITSSTRKDRWEVSGRIENHSTSTNGKRIEIASTNSKDLFPVSISTRRHL